jgi:hypothetical protein
MATPLVPKGQHGFDVAQGLMAHSAVPQHQLERARSAFKGEALKGFDTAVALHMGRVLSPPRPVKMGPPAKYVGYFVTKGSQGASPGRIMSVARIVTAADPNAKAGAMFALKELTKKAEASKAVARLPSDSRPYTPEPPTSIAAACPWCGAPQPGDGAVNLLPENEPAPSTDTAGNTGAFRGLVEDPLIAIGAGDARRLPTHHHPYRPVRGHSRGLRR